MRLNVLSDLHLSLGALAVPANDADAVVLAGDIARPKEAIAWASGFAKPLGESPFTPEASAALFKRHAGWLESKLAEPYAGPSVVITHHAPSRKSIHPRFANSLMNACFVSDAERLIDGSRTRLWIHGHTHDSFDYLVNGTRVLCNPRGYAKNGVNENPSFDANLLATIG